MANTYSQIYIQIVFAVKGRKCFIQEEFREAVQKYIARIIEKNGQKLYAIYCMPDHVHILVSLSPNISISDLVRDIKANSSKYLNEQFLLGYDFCWQAGFGAFSYAKSQSQQVVNYVINQKEHHRKKTFKEEYLKFLEKLEIKYNEKYLFEFYEDEAHQ
jgi:REP element-mobilizing transposase RayT